jgi:hypothetical protein
MRDNPKKYANGRPVLLRRFWLTNQVKLIPTASQIKRRNGMPSNISVRREMIFSLLV